MSAVLFGASTPLAKIAVSSADPMVVAGLLYLGSGIGLAVLRTVRADLSQSEPKPHFRGQICHGSPGPPSPEAWSGPPSSCWGC